MSSMSKSLSATFTRARRSACSGGALKNQVELEDLNPTPDTRVTKKRAVRPPTTFYTVEAAADVLSLDPTALRARLRRAQRAEGGTIVADLGGGISGFKFGKSWRLRFPER